MLGLSIYYVKISWNSNECCGFGDYELFSYIKIVQKVIMYYFLKISN